MQLGSGANDTHLRQTGCPHTRAARFASLSGASRAKAEVLYAVLGSLVERAGVRKGPEDALVDAADEARLSDAGGDALAEQLDVALARIVCDGEA